MLSHQQGVFFPAGPCQNDIDSIRDCRTETLLARVFNFFKYYPRHASLLGTYTCKLSDVHSLSKQARLCGIILLSRVSVSGVLKLTRLRYDGEILPLFLSHPSCALPIQAPHPLPLRASSEPQFTYFRTSKIFKYTED